MKQEPTHLTRMIAAEVRWDRRRFMREAAAAVLEVEGCGKTPSEVADYVRQLYDEIEKRT